jgi:Amidase
MRKFHDTSGGTAAAIAARLAPLGVAEDTEGSIRVPAAFCGIAGFRPTTGRYSTQGRVPTGRCSRSVQVSNGRSDRWQPRRPSCRLGSDGR